jgi:hypothetical protein
MGWTKLYYNLIEEGYSVVEARKIVSFKRKSNIEERRKDVRDNKSKTVGVRSVDSNIQRGYTK